MEAPNDGFDLACERTRSRASPVGWWPGDKSGGLFGCLQPWDIQA